MVLLICLGVWFAIYLRSTAGAERRSAFLAAGLVATGSMLLLWSYTRRAAPGEDDGFLGKLLAGSGEALLLGAVLSFGFGLVGRQLSVEQTSRDLKRDLAGQVRAASSNSKAFLDVDLSGEVFRGLDLTGFNFSYSVLNGANFLETSLAGARFQFSQLRGANFGGRSDLSGADLSNADLSNAVLNLVDLTGASLYSARLNGASLPGANLAGASLVSANLTGALLTRANLTDADLTNAELADVYCDETTEWPDDFVPPECLDPDLYEYKNPYR